MKARLEQIVYWWSSRGLTDYIVLAQGGVASTLWANLVLGISDIVSSLMVFC